MKRASLYLILIFLLIPLVLLSLKSGAVALSWHQVLTGMVGQASDATNIIIQELRVPRLLLAFLIGAGLGMSGAALQGLLRNPLADPGILGISSASGLGGVIAVYYGLTSIFPYALPVLAIAFGGIATLVLVIMASRDASVLTLILAGVAISAIAGALTSLAMSMAPTPLSMQEMIMWMLGSLENRSMTDVALATPFILLGMAMILPTSKALSTLVLGEDTAKSMGINLPRTRSLIVFGSAACVGAGVAVAGMIGFVGLVVPHLVRPYVGHDPGRSLIPSALMGGVILLIADMIARQPLVQAELRLGVLTAMIGAPFFLWIIWRTRGEMR